MDSFLITALTVFMCFWSSPVVGSMVNSVDAEEFVGPQPGKCVVFEQQLGVAISICGIRWNSDGSLQLEHRVVFPEGALPEGFERVQVSPEKMYAKGDRIYVDYRGAGPAVLIDFVNGLWDSQSATRAMNIDSDGYAGTGPEIEVHTLCRIDSIGEKVILGAKRKVAEIECASLCAELETLTTKYLLAEGLGRVSMLGNTAVRLEKTE